MTNAIKPNSQLVYNHPRHTLNMESFFPSQFLKVRSRNFPSVNIFEAEEKYIVDVIAPGFKKEDFKINVSDDMLTIRAQTNFDLAIDSNFDESNYSYNAFTRSLRLPENIKCNTITASYKDTVLQLQISKN